MDAGSSRLSVSECAGAGRNSEFVGKSEGESEGEGRSLSVVVTLTSEAKVTEYRTSLTCRPKVHSIQGCSYLTDLTSEATASLATQRPYLSYEMCFAAHCLLFAVVGLTPGAEAQVTTRRPKLTDSRPSKRLRVYQ